MSVSNFKDELDLIRQVREETLSERHASASVDRADIAPRSPSGVSVDVAVIFIIAFIIGYHFVFDHSFISAFMFCNRFHRMLSRSTYACVLHPKLSQGPRQRLQETKSRFYPLLRFCCLSIALLLFVASKIQSAL